MKKLLSGNEALALGAYDAGVRVASAYPGTPSSEILESLSRFKDIYTEWSTNEKVATEVALGAAYAGVRSLVAMKHVGLNVAADSFMAAAITGIPAGMVIISADDPGIHSSQNEQDNRHYAKFASIPLLEPGDSQEAYDLMAIAFDISEHFDTPVMVRTTTRISHSKSVVIPKAVRNESKKTAGFTRNVAKYVMLPNFARQRTLLLAERIAKTAEFAETFSHNIIIKGSKKLGIITSGIAYQYAREVFPKASFLKLGMTFPLPKNLIAQFASHVDRLIVVEELSPFLQENQQVMGIKVSGKEFIPRTGELNADILADAGQKGGLITNTPAPPAMETPAALPKRPPLLCPGCPHTGLFFVLSSLGQRNQPAKEADLVVTGDIGCYTLGAYPPLQAIDTCGCMGASIGQAHGIAKALGKSDKKVVAVIGDSTFMHSGITGLVDAVYNQSQITLIILNNHTTAMTGHQEHPGTGISAQGVKTTRVDIASLVRGIGVSDIKTADAFNIKALRKAVKDSINNPELSVIIVNGTCAVRLPTRSAPRAIDTALCNQCGTCLWLGCSAIQKHNGQMYIDANLCAGEACAICQQICPQGAIKPHSEVVAK